MALALALMLCAAGAHAQEGASKSLGMLWEGARLGDVSMVQVALQNGAAIDAPEPECTQPAAYPPSLSSSWCPRCRHPLASVARSNKRSIVCLRCTQSSRLRCTLPPRQATLRLRGSS